MQFAFVYTLFKKRQLKGTVNIISSDPPYAKMTTLDLSEYQV